MRETLSESFPHRISLNSTTLRPVRLLLPLRRRGNRGAERQVKCLGHSAADGKMHGTVSTAGEKARRHSLPQGLSGLHGRGRRATARAAVAAPGEHAKTDA